MTRGSGHHMTLLFFFFSSRRRHTRCGRDWSSDVCSSELFMATVLATIDYDITVPLLGYKLLKGSFYLVYETVLDLFGLFFVLGLGMALWRRFVLRPERIDPTARFAGALALLLVINVTGFVMEACRLAAGRPPLAAGAPGRLVLPPGKVSPGISRGARPP